MKSTQRKSVIILWEDEDVKQLNYVLKVLCRRTNNLSAAYDHQKNYIYKLFFIRKPFFCLSLNFLKMTLEIRNQAEIFLIFFLNFCLFVLFNSLFN